VLILPKKMLFLNKNKTNPVEVLGALPSDFSAVLYRLMKRGDYFYAVVYNDPQNGRASTAVKTLNFISKTKDFINWTGSQIGSGFTTYDKKSDSFYSTTLGMLYEGTANGTALMAYHITKINPDTFEYTNTTIMPDTKMSETSRVITPVQRVGNYLMFMYYKDHTNVYMCYSTDNGSTWTSKQIYSVSSYGYGGSGLKHVGNGSKSMISGNFGSTSQTVRCFTSPAASALSNCKMCVSDNMINTAANNFYYLDTTNKVFYKTEDLINYSHTFSYTINSIHSNSVFKDGYLISTCNGSLRVDLYDDSYLGYISIFDLSTGKMYLFDTGLNIAYSRTSGSYTYTYGYIQIIGLIEDYVYFIFKNNTTYKSYKIARTPVSYILENMQAA